MAVEDRLLTNSLSHKEAINHSIKEDYVECQRIMRSASKNYTLASYFLPREKRQHVEALYALVRIGDDLVDVNHNGFKSASAAIKSWHNQYWQAFETGDSPHPVLRAYIHTAQKFDIPIELMNPYFQAMSEDLTITRFPRFEHLLHYIDGSAIPVGRAMCHILGTYTSEVSDAYSAAESLAIAMQLSNFWRDIAEDWDRGRIYIPLEDLDRFQYTEKDIENQQLNENFIKLMEYQFERTELYYEQAYQGIKLLRSGQWAVLNALNLYRSIIDSIRQNNYDVFTQRASAPTLMKVWMVTSSIWRI